MGRANRNRSEWYDYEDRCERGTCDVAPISAGVEPTPHEDEEFHWLRHVIPPTAPPVVAPTEWPYYTVERIRVQAAK